jgi:predicted  nucleic acid-binding Zn-ribbon protein
MRKTMDCLIELQKLQFDTAGRAAAAKTGIEKLRTEVPPLLLAHYDRFAQRGKKGVALARNGVCSECHLRIPVGKVAGLSAPDKVHRCDNCGRYLCLPEGESSATNGQSAVAAPARPKRPRKAVANVL